VDDNVYGEVDHEINENGYGPKGMVAGEGLIRKSEDDGEMETASTTG